MRARRLLPLLAVAACAGPPGGPLPFEWHVALGDLDDALLSGCAGDGRLVLVGGRAGDGVIYERSDGDWSSPRLPDATSVLWWCWIDDRGRGFAVGERGRVLRDAGGGWRVDDTAGAVPSDVALYGVWGAARDDVWAVGGASSVEGSRSVIAHYDGIGWSPVAGDGLPEHVLLKVWGAASDDVWAVGEGGTVLHWNGAAWSPAAAPTTQRLVAVWGSAADDVYAVGGDGTGIILHYDGRAWAQLAETTQPLAALFTAPARPLYVGGNRGYLARFPRDGAGVASRPDAEAIPIDSVDVHGLLSDGTTVVATAADLLTGGASGWHGTALSHGGDLAGPIVGPDGGAADASAPPIDAAPIDAAAPDAPPPDATPALDAVPPDAALPGPGEVCATTFPRCRAPYVCWLLASSDVLLCSENCTADDDCTAVYGDGSCCRPPGPQTLETLCIPGSYAECG